MKKVLLVAIALVALAWAVPLGPPTALADASVEVDAPVVSREGSDLRSIMGPTVDVTATADVTEVTVMVSDIDLFFNLHGLVHAPDPTMEIKVCTEDELPCTES